MWFWAHLELVGQGGHTLEVGKGCFQLCLWWFLFSCSAGEWYLKWFQGTLVNVYAHYLWTCFRFLVLAPSSTACIWRGTSKLHLSWFNFGNRSVVQVCQSSFLMDLHLQWDSTKPLNGGRGGDSALNFISSHLSSKTKKEKKLRFGPITAFETNWLGVKLNW